MLRLQRLILEAVGLMRLILSHDHTSGRTLEILCKKGRKSFRSTKFNNKQLLSTIIEYYMTKNSKVT